MKTTHICLTVAAIVSIILNLSSSICLSNLKLVWGNEQFESDNDLSKIRKGNNINGKQYNPNAISIAKLRQQLQGEDQLTNFDRTRPIFVDMGMSDGADTDFRLSRGDSVVAVDAYSPWVEKAKEKFASYIQNNRLILFNIGLSTEDGESMPLYYKNEGDVISSFDVTKGCQHISPQSPKCKHTDVGVVRCEAILDMIGVQANHVKVDIEMLHHSCVRGLSRLPTHLLPETICWEEHDKPFGSGSIPRGITDMKLILGLYELGYDGIKVVLQGYKATAFYGIPKEKTGFFQGSGRLTPDEMMHYRSYEREGNNGNFDTDWRTVEHIVMEGMFSPGSNKARHFFTSNSYYDICMKLGPDAINRRKILSNPENFPLSSYAST